VNPDQHRGKAEAKGAEASGRQKQGPVHGVDCIWPRYFNVDVEKLVG
jgi:hypothetical protein